MSTLTFDEPVNILIGLGFPTAIRSVFMAHHIVSEWPSALRGARHAAALAACRKALNGEGSARDARAAFEMFARRADILIEDADPVIAAGALKRTGAPAA